MQLDLRDIIDGLRSKPYVTGNKPAQNFYPSSASVKYTKDGEVITVGECMRKTWYDWMGFGKYVSSTAIPSPRMSRLWQVGDLLGDMFVKEFKEAGLWIGDEVPFYIPELKVSGRVDLLIKDPYKAPKPPGRPSPDQTIGIEFKTVGGWMGVKGPIISTKDTPLGPKPENVLQCLVYLSYFSKWGINKWILLYIDRAMGQSEANPKHYNCHTISIDDNDHPVISNDEGTVTWDHITVSDVLRRYQVLDKYIQDKTIPPRDYAIQYTNAQIITKYQNGSLNKTDTSSVEAYLKRNGKKAEDVTDDDVCVLTKGDWRCQYCDYKSICYSDTPDKGPDIVEDPTVVIKAPPPPVDEPDVIKDLV